VQASTAEKAAAEFSARGLRKIEQLGGRLNSEVIPNLDSFQAAHLARRFGLSASAARIIASLAFGRASR
jgi:hypothetical protein